MYSAENAGLIKFDFLGLKTLTVINNTSKMVKEIDQDFDIKKINYNDEKVFNLLSKGHTVGLFQLESSGMKEALMQMRPNHLEDIIALVALMVVQWQTYQHAMTVSTVKKNLTTYILY